jgi:hypothetical protein
MNHQSGSFFLTQNIFNSVLNSNQNNIPAAQRPTIGGNIVNNNTTLNHISSSIQTNNNIFNSQQFQINNHFSSSLNTAANARIDVSRNIFHGFGNSIYVSGSGASNNVRSINDNLIGGRSNIVSSSYVGSNSAGLISTIAYGEGLNISGSNTSNGGSAFFGRYNATGSLQESSQETVFVVGTGTGIAGRRNAIRVNSSGNTEITGSLFISGSQSITGSLIIRGNLFQGNNISTPNTGAFSTSVIDNNITQGGVAFNLFSSSINAQNNVIFGETTNVNNFYYHTGSNNRVDVLTNIIGGLNNTITFNGNPSTNTSRVFGANIFGGNNSTISLIATGSDTNVGSSIIYGQNILVEPLTNIDGAAIFGKYNKSVTGNTIFVVGNGTSTGDRRNAIEVDGSNNIIVSGSVNISGSLLLNGAPVGGGSTVGLITTGSIGTNQSITGSINGNVVAVSPDGGRTGSFNLNDGNFFTINLSAASQDYRFEFSNIKAGQTANIKVTPEGGNTAIFPSYVKQISGSAYIPTNVSGSTDILTLVSFDGTNLNLVNVKNLV